MPRITDAELTVLATKAGEVLQSAGMLLATAESCTGGWVGRAITAVPGSSVWYERGFITYSDAAKREMLGVRLEVLAQYGAVSESTVRLMAEGALTHSHADVALAITGVAGPGGGSEDKPVGTVWFAWASRKRPTQAVRHQLEGDREAVRCQSVATALRGLLDFIASDSPHSR